MKRYTLYTFAALALLLAATACTQDDAGLLPEASEGTPIVFTATGLTPATATRATVDGDWEGVTTVAIQIGNEVKAYRVTPSADNLTVTLSSDDPHYWTGGSSVTVSGRKFRHRIGMVPLYRGRDLDTCRGGAGRPKR